MKIRSRPQLAPVCPIACQLATPPQISQPLGTITGRLPCISRNLLNVCNKARSSSAASRCNSSKPQANKRRCCSGASVACLSSGINRYGTACSLKDNLPPSSRPTRQPWQSSQCQACHLPNARAAPPSWQGRPSIPSTPVHPWSRRPPHPRWHIRPR